MGHMVNPGVPSAGIVDLHVSAISRGPNCGSPTVAFGVSRTGLLALILIVVEKAGHGLGASFNAMIGHHTI